MTGMRICLVAPGFSRERDEPGLAAVLDLVERIAADNEVEVVALRHPPGRSAYRLAGATVHPLGLGHATGAAARARVLARGVRAVTTQHRRHPLDVIHALWADEAGAVATLAARVTRVPTIVSLMGGELVALADIGYGAILGRGGRWSVQTSLRLAKRVTVGSTRLHDLARPHLADDDNRLRVQPLGVDLSIFRPAGAPPMRPTVLFAGSLEPVKDPETAVRAFSLLAESRPAVQLIVAGSGSMRRQLDRLAAELGISERIEFLGHIPRNRMAELYRATSVLCITSRHEAQSMVAVEAAACGVPVVGTDVGVLADLGDGARTVPEADPAALAAALGEVLDNPAEAARMGAAARAAAEVKFDIDHAAAEMLGLYAEVSRPPAAAPES